MACRNRPSQPSRRPVANNWKHSSPVCKFQQGAIDLQDGLATLHVPEGFRFLNGADASTVLVKIWGNPPQTAPLGMLMPAEAGPLSEDGWGVIITYEADGYVKDADAEKINYSGLLDQMQKSVASRTQNARKPGIHRFSWSAGPKRRATIVQRTNFIGLRKLNSVKARKTRSTTAFVC